jgi:hypothetical protein
VLQQVQFRATVPQPNLATTRVLAQTNVFFFFEKPNQKSISTHNTQTANTKSN